MNPSLLLRNRPKNFFSLLAVCALNLFVFSSLHAQSVEKKGGAKSGPKSKLVRIQRISGMGIQAPLPDDVPPLPEPDKLDKAVFLSRRNVEAYKDLLIAPLATWLEEDIFAARVFSRLAFRWRLSEAWEAASSAENKKFSVSSSRSLQPAGEDEQSAPSEKKESYLVGYPFGMSVQIDQEQDPVRKADMILWNLQIGQSVMRDVLYEGDISWIGTQSLLRNSRFLLYRRFYPFAEEEEDKPNYFWREFFQLLSPPVVFGFAHLTDRRWSDAEDGVYVHSPVIGKNRRVLGSNRSDALLGGELTPDDFFVWSTKLQETDAKVVGEKTLFVPFSSTRIYSGEMLSGEPRGGASVMVEGESTELPAHKGVVQETEKILTASGGEQKSDGSATFVLWNYESKKYLSHAAWVPTSAVFIPRSVWIIEIATRDPYYQSGREILIVDKESMLPVYKISYDHYGQYSKVVLGAWSLARAEKKELSFPFISFVLAVDRTARRATSLTTHSVRTFNGEKTESSKALIALLDIDKHTKAEEKESGNAAQGAKNKGSSGGSPAIGSGQGTAPSAAQEGSASSAPKNKPKRDSEKQKESEKTSSESKPSETSAPETAPVVPRLQPVLPKL